MYLAEILFAGRICNRDNRVHLFPFFSTIYRIPASELRADQKDRFLNAAGAGFRKTNSNCWFGCVVILWRNQSRIFVTGRRIRVGRILFGTICHWIDIFWKFPGRKKSQEKDRFGGLILSQRVNLLNKLFADVDSVEFRVSEHRLDCLRGERQFFGQLYTYRISHFAAISRLFSRYTPQNTKHSLYTFRISFKFRLRNPLTFCAKCCEMRKTRHKIRKK